MRNINKGSERVEEKEKKELENLRFLLYSLKKYYFEREDSIKGFNEMVKRFDSGDHGISNKGDRDFCEAKSQMATCVNNQFKGLLTFLGMEDELNQPNKAKG